MSAADRVEANAAIERARRLLDSELADRPAQDAGVEREAVRALQRAVAALMRDVVERLP